MRQAAFACTVVVLYRAGQRMTARELLRAEHPCGWLVCQDRYTQPTWYACLFDCPEMKRQVMQLNRVVLQRENDGVRLYGGLEVDTTGRRDMRQAWLCAPTPERAREVLTKWAAKEAGEV